MRGNATLTSRSSSSGEETRSSARRRNEKAIGLRDATATSGRAQTAPCRQGYASPMVALRGRRFTGAELGVVCAAGLAMFTVQSSWFSLTLSLPSIGEDLNV